MSSRPFPAPANAAFLRGRPTCTCHYFYQFYLCGCPDKTAPRGRTLIHVPSLRRCDMYYTPPLEVAIHQRNGFQHNPNPPVRSPHDEFLMLPFPCYRHTQESRIFLPLAALRKTRKRLMDPKWNPTRAAKINKNRRGWQLFKDEGCSEELKKQLREWQLFEDEGCSEGLKKRLRKEGDDECQPAPKRARVADGEIPGEGGVSEELLEGLRQRLESFAGDQGAAPPESSISENAASPEVASAPMASSAPSSSPTSSPSQPVDFYSAPTSMPPSPPGAEQPEPSADSGKDHNSAYHDIPTDFTLDEDIYDGPAQQPTPPPSVHPSPSNERAEPVPEPEREQEQQHQPEPRSSPPSPPPSSPPPSRPPPPPSPDHHPYPPSGWSNPRLPRAITTAADRSRLHYARADDWLLEDAVRVDLDRLDGYRTLPQPRGGGEGQGRGKRPEHYCEYESYVHGGYQRGAYKLDGEVLEQARAANWWAEDPRGRLARRVGEFFARGAGAGGWGYGRLLSME